VKKMGILKDHSDSAINDSMEANLIGFWSMCKSLPNMDLYKGDDMLRLFTGLPHPLMNEIVRAQLDDENLEAKVEETINFFKQRTVPFMWQIGPSSRPNGLGEIISTYGLTKLEHDPPGMAVDLRKLDEATFHETTNRSNVTIKQVQNAGELRKWSSIVGKCFDFPDSVTNAFNEMMTVVLGEEENLVNYLAFLNGDPVASSTVAYSAGVAGIWCVGTLSKHRGQGIGTAITMAPLLDARKRGYEISILSSTEQGFNVYRRMGFKKTCEWRQYVWTPD
jgi:ribosomal protein S18 acetylase RimI-like enzyme